MPSQNQMPTLTILLLQFLQVLQELWFYLVRRHLVFWLSTRFLLCKCCVQSVIVSVCLRITASRLPSVANKLSMIRFYFLPSMIKDQLQTELLKAIYQCWCWPLVNQSELFLSFQWGQPGKWWEKDSVSFCDGNPLLFFNYTLTHTQLYQLFPIVKPKLFICSSGYLHNQVTLKQRLKLVQTA